MVLEKNLESPLDYKEIKPISPKRNHPWIFLGRTDAEAEAPRADSLEKTLMLGNTEGKKRRGRQNMRWLDSVTKSMDMNLSTALRAAVHVVTKNQIWLTNWTTRRNWTPLTLSSYLVGAAAAAKSLQSCATLCNPICGSPPGSSIPGIFQEWVAVSFFYLVALENKRKNVHFFWPSDYIINAFCW